MAPRRSPAAGPAVIQQVRAAAALVAFFNALAVPLFGLAPGISVRYPAVALGVGGILFTAAGIRSIWSSPATTRQRVRQLGLVVALLLIFGTQLTAGAILLVESRRSIPLELICLALVASLLVGVARAWELVGARDTGIIASLAVLSRHAPSPARLTRLSLVPAWPGSPQMATRPGLSQPITAGMATPPCACTRGCCPTGSASWAPAIPTP